ncbi:PREDICTED: cytosolic endo-beta-N-acetylglucosaminidase [Drosophila arizonae]|uniref:Cytosolic endo-beta-N-acetylglucosaminidase n=1 Tax=Drosophila arizonae TaxID=7263 RepID=A0ABM1PYX0_DROAR|nr:PREDICTED: cytosolic endo-beta-N-acetylglucosaminidase [Drosophila arizonae]
MAERNVDLPLPEEPCLAAVEEEAAAAAATADAPAGQQLSSCTATKMCPWGCPKLEAEPIRDNRQLLEFQVRSRDIDWKLYVRPLDTQVRGEAVYLDRQSDLLSNHRRTVSRSGRRELLVCHDMMGNYLTDRHYHSSQKYDDYRFMHWSAVDYFCYFSHNYVTIPPSGWLNAAHRHGVPVLGTYIAEGSTGSRLLHEVLASAESVQRAATAMTRLCLHFGFEGWLVNVECQVRPEAMPNLYLFVEELRRLTEAQVPSGRVFWYDSVVSSGELHWQNELNDRNVRFFRASHGTLINYSWDDRSLANSEATIQREGAPPHRLFMGLDVFGRGQVGRFRSAQTLARIAARGFSAGIFAPAWCFETLQQFNYNIRDSSGDESVNAAFLLRNEYWWARLWPSLATHPYRRLPFYTNFCVGSGRSSFECGARQRTGRPFFNLARQALQPSVPLGGNAERSFDTAYAGGCALRIVNYVRAFRLFLTEFQLPQGILLLGYAYKISAPDESHALDVVLRLCPPQQPMQDVYVFCGDYGENVITQSTCYISPVGGALPPSLLHEQLPLERGALGENWRVRYYLARFDGPVQLQDIGVLGRRPDQSTSEAYIGAIYVHGLQPDDWEKLQPSHRINIPLYSQQLWRQHEIIGNSAADRAA